MAWSKIAGVSLKSHYRLIISLSAGCAWVDSSSDCLGSCVSPVLPDLSAPPTALDAQQWLHRGVRPRDVGQGGEVALWRGASQSIAEGFQRPETPVHRLFSPQPPAERVSLTPPSHPRFPFNHLSIAVSPSPACLGWLRGMKDCVVSAQVLDLNRTLSAVQWESFHYCADEIAIKGVHLLSAGSVARAGGCWLGANLATVHQEGVGGRAARGSSWAAQQHPTREPFHPHYFQLQSPPLPHLSPPPSLPLLFSLPRSWRAHISFDVSAVLTSPHQLIEKG